MKAKLWTKCIGDRRFECVEEISCGIYGEPFIGASRIEAIGQWAVATKRVENLLGACSEGYALCGRLAIDMEFVDHRNLDEENPAFPKS